MLAGQEATFERNRAAQQQIADNPVLGDGTQTLLRNAAIGGNNIAQRGIAAFQRFAPRVIQGAENGANWLFNQSDNLNNAADNYGAEIARNTAQTAEYVRQQTREVTVSARRQSAEMNVLARSLTYAAQDKARALVRR